MTEKQKDLCFYRMAQAEETIQSAHLCMENHLFKDATLLLCSILCSKSCFGIG